MNSALEREEEIFKLLEKLKGIEFIVVGGYAINAYTRHRFSVDLDIVIAKKSLKDAKKILNNNGYVIIRRKTDFSNIYKGEFISFEKDINGKVTADLMINALVSRTTDAAFSYQYMKKYSEKRTISGTTTSIDAKVPAKELLIATKLHSGRLTDIRDIVVLNKNIEKNILLKHVKRGDQDKLKNTLENSLKYLKHQNFIDSLKGVFTFSREVKPDIKRTEILLNFIIKIIEKQKT